MTPKYRSDIDGLRAVAVLAVIFFHFGIELFSGGFVGVGVFFVISGYLITSIIISEIKQESFSIARFYERRFRRILPALVFVAIVVLIAGSILFHPKHLVDLGRSMIATTLFSSNVLFYTQSGYFDHASELKPLLHTWSLAVEEQFYIFFPIILLAVAKYTTGKFFKWVVIIFFVSFLLSLAGMKVSESGTFYLIFTRAWELLAGSLLAIKAFPLLRNQSSRDGFSFVGLFMIIYSVFFFTSETEFPGFWALIPVVGAAIIIYAGEESHSAVGKISEMPTSL